MYGLNLLPWREQLREQRKRNFFIMLSGSGVFALACIVMLHLFMSYKIGQQKNVNHLVEQEISIYDEHIAEIRDLKKNKQEMLQRLNLIQILQASRPMTVKLYDELVRITPPGIYIKNLKREGNIITIYGKAESNIRVSIFMRNIEASQWLEKPILSEIKTNVDDVNFPREFTLQLNLKISSMMQNKIDNKGVNHGS